MPAGQFVDDSLDRVTAAVENELKRVAEGIARGSCGPASRRNLAGWITQLFSPLLDTDAPAALEQQPANWSAQFFRPRSDPDELTSRGLVDVVCEELDRLGSFAVQEETSLRAHLELLGAESQKRSAQKEELSPALDELGARIVHLDAFQQVYIRGLRNILQKYDRCATRQLVSIWALECRDAWKESRVAPRAMEKVANSHFMRVDFNSLLVLFSRVATNLRDPTPPSSSTTVETHSSASEAPSRKHAFLVRVKDSVKVRVQLARQLELSVSGTGATCRRTSSIYFDNPSLSVYRAHVGGSADISPASPCDAVHVKIVEGFRGMCFVHEQTGAGRREVWLRQAEASRVFSPPGSEPCDDARGLSEDVQAALRRGSLLPVAQSTYARTTFQDEAAGITALLDEDVRMASAREWDSRNGAPEYFPYAVLSVQFAAGSGAEGKLGWLQRLCNTGVARPIVGFSKAAHVVGCSLARKCGLPLPPWQRRVGNRARASDRATASRKSMDFLDSARSDCTGCFQQVASSAATTTSGIENATSSLPTLLSSPSFSGSLPDEKVAPNSSADTIRTCNAP